MCPCCRLLVAGSLCSGFSRGLDAIVSGQNQTRFYTRIINKWGCVIPVMAHFRMMLAEDGDVEGFTTTYVTLPPDVAPNDVGPWAS